MHSLPPPQIEMIATDERTTHPGSVIQISSRTWKVASQDPILVRSSPTGQEHALQGQRERGGEGRTHAFGAAVQHAQPSAGGSAVRGGAASSGAVAERRGEQRSGDSVPMSLLMAAQKESAAAWMGALR
mmetsp:Transcript_36235/g.90173  ORF Transcript_36235/g.90173 Transcript_36235/m.90173 type:complete len:129 (+) Transcript_36235:192-578(+)